MRKLLLTAAVAVSLSSNAMAGAIFTSFITNPGGANTITDNSVSQVVFDAGGNGTLGVGDIVQGLLRFDQNTDPGGFTAGATQQLIVAFSFELAAYTGPVPALAGTYFDLAPVTTAGFTLKDMFPTLLAGYTAADLTGGLFAVVEATGSNPTNDPLATALAAIDSGYSLDFVGGLIDSDDFLAARLDVAATPFPAFAGGIIVGIGDERGGLSVIEATNLSGFDFPEVTPALPYSNSFADITLHQLGFLGQLRTLTAGQFADGYDVADKADISFTAFPVPEPASMLLWTSLAAFAGFRGYRRKTNVVA